MADGLDYRRGLLPFGASKAEPLKARSREYRGAMKLLIGDKWFAWRPQGSSVIYHRAAIPEGTAEAREYMASLVDCDLGFGSVPHTEWRKWQGQWGSLQQWVSGDYAIWGKIDPDDPNSVSPGLEEIGWPTVAKLWVLQAIVLNIDSTRENLLWSPSDRNAYVLDLRECLPAPGHLAALGKDFNPAFPWWRDTISNWQLPTEATSPLHDISWDSLMETGVRVGVAEACMDAARRRAGAILERPVADIAGLIAISDADRPDAEAA